MTVQTQEGTTPAAPPWHGQRPSVGNEDEAHANHADEARAHHVTERRAGGTGGAALTAVLALPRPVRIIGGAGIGIGALLAVGVPLATLTPLLALGGCLGMHLFMGHGMSHGGGHGSHETGDGAAGAGGAEDTSSRRDG